MPLKKKVFENIMEKGEKAGNHTVGQYKFSLRNLNSLPHNLKFIQSKKKNLLKTEWENEKNAGNQHLPSMFSIISGNHHLSYIQCHLQILLF